MCGICGVASTSVTNREMEVWKQLLFLSVFRGKDSTGVAGLSVSRKKPSFFTDKALLASPVFLQMKDKMLTNYLNSNNVKALIGHARFATVGEKKIDNAHPFETPNLIGVHNGTISEYTRKRIKNHDKYETDSEALLNSFDSEGLYATMDALDDLGAYACVWMDKRTGELNFYRNKERELWLVYGKNSNVLFWASELRFLEFVFEGSDIEMQDPWLLKTHTLISYPMATSKRPFHECTIEEMKYERKWAAPVPITRSRWVNGVEIIEKDEIRHSNPIWDNKHWKNPEYFDVDKMWDNDTQRYIDRPTKEVGKEVEGAKFQRNANETFFMIGTHGYTRVEYEAKLKNGCSWCDFQSGVKADVLWSKSGHEYLCQFCKVRPELADVFIAA